MDTGLLLLHGFTGSPRSWNTVVRPLRERYTVLAPALVGHAEAPALDVHGFEDEVDRIASLASGGDRWHLAGYSLGGRIALGLMVRHPALFSSATLIGTQPGLATEAERIARRDADERWCALLAERGLADFVAAWEAQSLFETQKNLPGEVLLEQRAERLAQSAAGFVRSLRSTGLGMMPSYWDALALLGTPTTLVAGELDSKFVSIATKMCALIPNAVLHVVPGAGHNVVLERPDSVRALLEKALGEVCRA